MCGILALVPGVGGADLVRSGADALNALRHRGPDDSGWLALDGAGDVLSEGSIKPEDFARVRLAVGFRRLAILDLSPAGHQPMRDPTGRYWLAFNGEIYNHAELRKELEQRGENFASRSDSEVLLRLLALDGPGSLARLDGMFALVFVDTRERALLAARDPFGIKPLYVWRPPSGGLAMASEIKAFTRLSGWSALADGQRLHDYLLRGLSDHTEHTMFAGVRQLPAGSMTSVQFGGSGRKIDEWPAHTRWYRTTDRGPIAPDDAPARVFEALSESVKRQLRADVRVGSCLSGGLDSTSIVAIACGMLPTEARTEFRTVTARPAVNAWEIPDEWRLVEQTLAMTGAAGTGVRVEPIREWSELGDLVWTQDEPFGSTSILAQSVVFAEAARQGVKVMLDGQGADEQLCGYDVFFPFAVGEHLKRAGLRSASSEIRTIRATRGKSLVWQGARAASMLLPRTTAVLRPRALAAGWIDAGALGARPDDPFLRLTPRAQDVRSCSVQQIEHASLPMLLHWEDRSSMAASVEARVPFLSPAVVETSLSLPTRSKIGNGRTKLALREAVRGLIPETIRESTRKVAFEAPERDWLVSGPSEVNSVVDRSLAFCTRLLTVRGRRALAEMRAGSRHYDRFLWRAVCAGVWIERFGVRL